MWREMTVADAADVLSGEPFDSTGFNSEGRGMPMIRNRDIEGWTGTSYDGHVPDRAVVRPGDVIVSMDGEFRVRAWSGPEAALNQRMCRVQGKSAVCDTGFLRYAIQPLLSAIEARTASTTVKHLSTKTLLAEAIRIPSLTEQRRIVDLLTAADRIVRALTTELEAAEACRGALVADLLACVNNRAPIGGLLTERTDTITVDNSVLYTQVTVAGKGRGMRLREQKLGRDIGTKKQMVLAADELVVSRIDARKGAACVVPREFAGAIVTSSFPCFQVDTAICVPEYLDLVVRSPEFARACDAISAGTTNRVAADMSRFGALLVPLPTVAKQRDIVSSVSTLDVRVAAARQRLQSANTLRDQLLHDLLSGAYTIPESYDRFIAEAAS
jgi:type I restriction enzyme S subunit